MSPKTGSNGKENNMETKNQLLNNNEEVNQNSTVDLAKLDNEESNQLLNDEESNQLLNDEESNQLLNVEKLNQLKDLKYKSSYQELNQNSTTESIRLDNELKFKLNLDNKDKLIAILNDYTALLYGDKNKEKVVERANDLMHSFVDLPLKIDQIEENVFDSIDNEPLKPTLIINSKMKTEITDLLIKNKNYYILFKDDKDAKLNLIHENNNLAIKLIQFPIQMLKEDDPINNDYVWKRVLIDKSNHTVDDLLMAKSKFDEKICELQEKISILNDQLVAKSKYALSTNRKESATHFLEIKQFYDFRKLNCGKINTLPFKCLGLDFIINIEKSKNNYHFELALINKLDINKNFKATCELILINNKLTKEKENMSLNLDLVFIQNKSFQSKGQATEDDLWCRYYGVFKFTDDEALKIQVNLTAELIELVD